MALAGSDQRAGTAVFDRGDGPPPLLRARIAAMADQERRRFFLWSPVALAIGIGSYFALPAEPAIWIAGLPLALALIVKALSARGSLAAALSSALLLAAVGFAVAKARVETVRAPVLEKNLSNAEIVGVVTRVEPRPPRGARLTLRVETLAGLSIEKRPLSVRVRTMSAADALRPGDRVRLSATLAPPSRPAIPGGFDFARSAWFERLGAVGYTFAKPILMPRSAPVGLAEHWSRSVESVRQALSQRIRAALPGEQGAIATALITGERGGITQETNDAYRSSGLFHILSISGLHMVIMAGAVFFSVRLMLAAIPALALRYPIKKWAAAAGIVGALGYLAISGGAFATVRSALMIVVIFSAVLLDRPALALRNVALSALIILALYPESLFDAGFQMSFAAVTGLVATYEEVRRRMGRRNEPHPVLRVLLFFGGIVFSTLIASIAVAPFAAYHFHQSQQYAILANLIAIPICNLIVMPAALAALMLMPLHLEALALIPMGYGIDAMTWCARQVAALPGAVGHIPAIPHNAFLLLVFGGLWLALWQTRVRFAGLVAIVCGLGLAPFHPKPDVLIARNGELVALRGVDGRLSALPAQQSRYELARWLEHDGDARQPADVARAEAFQCDGIGCVARVKGARIAVARHPAAIADDCAVARVAILSQPRPQACRTDRTVIDFFDVWRDGTHALYIEAGTGADGPHQVRIDTVAAHRGNRPWAPRIEKRAPSTVRGLPKPIIRDLRNRQSGTTAAAPIDPDNPMTKPPTLPRFASRPDWLTDRLPRADVEDDWPDFERDLDREPDQQPDHDADRQSDPERKSEIQTLGDAESGLETPPEPSATPSDQ